MHFPIKVGTSPTLKIRGVLASEQIKKGQVIEKCPVILFPKKEAEYIDKTVFTKYYYEWNRDYYALVLGLGCLYNHSYEPNAVYHFDFTNQLWVAKARKVIEENEEITVNYNFYPDSKDPLYPELIDFDEHRK